jgi:hypothetical protein
MPIDVFNEKVVSLSQATKLLPKPTRGTKMNVSTLLSMGTIRPSKSQRPNSVA